MKKKLTIVLLFLITGLISVWAFRKFPRGGEQLPVANGREELKRLYNRYIGSTGNVTVAGTVQLLDEENNNRLKEQASFESVRNGRDMYTRFSYLQTIIKDSLCVQLDTVNKSIVVGQLNHDLSGGRGQSLFPFEKFIDDSTEFKVTVLEGGDEHERVLDVQYALTPEIKSTKIYYDPVSYTMKRAEIEWWKGTHFDKSDENKVWLSRINYTSTIEAALNINNLFHSIVQINEGWIKPAETYKDYSIQAAVSPE